jgi:polyisoprenoid-binding protein YceI
VIITAACVVALGRHSQVPLVRSRFSGMAAGWTAASLPTWRSGAGRRNIGAVTVPSTFRFVPERSRIDIHARSSLHAIHATAREVTGAVTVRLDGDVPDLTLAPRAEVVVAASGVTTGNVAYDVELRRRIEARRHPTITGIITDVSVAPGDHRYRVDGELTFHGVTQAVAVEMKVRVEDSRLSAEWEQAIDIRDFGLTPPRVLMMKVDPEVQVTVRLEAERVQDL